MARGFKPKVYIAGPLFNSQQVEILKRIEETLSSYEYSIYRPRLDSGSHLMSLEEKKDYNKWTPIFNRNEEEIHSCDILLAVLEYPMPRGNKLGIYREDGDTIVPLVKSIEIPDSGTVWEMGAARALGKLVIGFYPTKENNKINLMLSHGCDGMIVGWRNLKGFFKPEDSRLSLLPDSVRPVVNRYLAYCTLETCSRLQFDYLETRGSKRKEIE